MGPKKIVYILTPIEFGGSERVNLTFLRNVDRTRFDISLALLTRPWEYKNFFMEQLAGENYTTYQIPVGLRPRTEGRDYFRILRCIKILCQISLEESFDLMHTHGYFADIISVPVSRILDVRHISTCHGFISSDRNLKIYNALDRFALRFCNRIISVSDEIKNELLRAGIRESKITVIQNAVQNSYQEEELAHQRIEKRRLLSIAQGEFVIGYVGRLSEEKGVQYLIEAAAVLKEKDETIKVIIIGDGPKRKELEDLAREKGFEKEIIFAGFQGDAENWLSSLDVFVLPSLTEGTPMALLEAMAAGIPTIASAVGGVPKVVEDGINGFLVAPGDFRSLSEKIIALKKNPELQKKMASEAANLIKSRFGVREWCRKIEAEYESLLSSKKVN